MTTQPGQPDQPDQPQSQPELADVLQAQTGRRPMVVSGCLGYAVLAIALVVVLVVSLGFWVLDFL